MRTLVNFSRCTSCRFHVDTSSIEYLLVSRAFDVTLAAFHAVDNLDDEFLVHLPGDKRLVDDGQRTVGEASVANWLGAASSDSSTLEMLGELKFGTQKSWWRSICMEGLL